MREKRMRQIQSAVGHEEQIEDESKINLDSISRREHAQTDGNTENQKGFRLWSSGVRWDFFKMSAQEGENLKLVIPFSNFYPMPIWSGSLDLISFQKIEKVSWIFFSTVNLVSWLK